MSETEEVVIATLEAAENPLDAGGIIDHFLGCIRTAGLLGSPVTLRVKSRPVIGSRNYVVGVEAVVSAPSASAGEERGGG